LACLLPQVKSLGEQSTHNIFVQIIIRNDN
jgi:hypothetical protein